MKSIFPAALLGFSPVAILAQEKITFVDHVKPVLENKCFSCHNPDKKRGDLDLTSFQGVMAGGGGGALVASGDPDSSKLITTTTKKAEPFMPPEGSPLTEKEVAILQAWINGGLLETASSIAKKSAPKVDLALKSSNIGKPEGPAAMPEHVLLEPVVVANRSTTITALAASPWAPLVAIAGNKQALLYDTERQVLAGIFPYPEGYLRSLKFSLNGSLLIGGGGQGGKMGNAVVWDVKTGKRVAEIGKEFDQVMTADLSPNQASVAIGGHTKRIKVYNTNTGEEQYVIKKHTEWVLSVQFSPDGVLLASADRNGNVIVSEASNGAEFYTMVSHKVACTDLAWRSDANFLASCGEDGKIYIYEMENGKVVKNWDAHPGGALSIAFTPDGKIVSVGRDKRIKTWDIQGKLLAQSPVQGEIVTAVAALHDQKTVVSGDWNGLVRLWTLDKDKYHVQGELSQNPPQLNQRLAEAERAVPQLAAKLEEQKKKVAGLQAQVATLRQALQAAQAQVETAKKEAGALPGQVTAKKAEIANLTKQHAELKTAVKPEDAASVQKAAAAEKVLKDSQAVLATLEKTAPAKAEAVKQREAALAKAQQALAGPWKQLQGAEAELAVITQAQPKAQQLVVELKAAVFNVALLSEKEKLEKLESDYASYKGALEETTKAKEGEQQQLSTLNANLPKLKEQLVPLQTALTAAQMERDKALQVYAPQEKLEREKLTAIEPLRGEIKAAEGKLGSFAPAKNDANAKLQAALAPLNKRKADAEAKAKPYLADKGKIEALVLKARQDKDASQKKQNDHQAVFVKQQKELADAKAAHEAAKADAAKAPALLQQVKAAEQAQKGSFDLVQAAKKEVAVHEATLQKESNRLAQVEGRLKPHQAEINKAQQEIANAQAATAKQVQELTNQENALKQALAEKKPRLAQLEQEHANLVKQHAGNKENLAAKSKLHQDAKAKADAVAAEIQSSTQKLAALAKSLPEKDSTLAEIRAELAKVEPGLAPLRAKVKQMSEQYLGMLGR